MFKILTQYMTKTSIFLNNIKKCILFTHFIIFNIYFQTLILGGDMKLLLITLIMFSTIFGATIDNSWFNDTNENLKTKYEKQLEVAKESLKGDTKPEIKEKLEYQKILLQRLIELNTQANSFKVEQIKDITSTKDFIEGLKDISTINNEYNKISNEIKNNTKKSKNLQDELVEFSKKDELGYTNIQLLYAFYTIKNKELNSNLQTIDSVLKDRKELFLRTIKSVKLQSEQNLNNNLKNLNEKLQKELNNQKSISIAYEKAQILNNQISISKIENQLQETKQTIESIQKEIVWSKVEDIITPLQNKDKNFFDKFKELQQFIQNNNLQYDYLIDIFKYLSREHIGLTHSTLADTKTGMIDVVKYSWSEMNKEYIPLGDGVSIIDIIKFLLIFVIGFTLASLYKRRIIVSVRFIQNSSPATRTMLANLGYYFLVFLTFMMALKSVGIDLSSLTMLVGALSVGIGFGLQNIVSNFISGIILIFEQSIKVGDIIEIEAGIRGRVTQINMRSSIITTFDNIEYIVPNSTFIQSNVINLTLTDDIRRLSIPFGVAYGSDVEKVSQIVLNSLNNSELVFIKNDPDRMPKIWMSAMGASSVDMTLLVWIDANNSKRNVDPSAPSDFLKFVYKTLNENSIEIPFPQMDLHIKSDFRA